MTMLAMLTTVVVVASVLLLSIKIAPLYIDDLAISSALASMENERNLYNLTKKQVRDKFSRKMTADYTRELTEDELIITKEKDALKIDVIYESRVPVVYNLDVVAKFSHHFEAKP